MRTFVTVIAIVGLAVSGCGSDSGPDSPELAASRIEVYSPTGKLLKVNGGAIGRVQLAESINIQITNGRLLINEKDYGPVKGGDKVNVESETVVKVNGEVRQAGKAP